MNRKFQKEKESSCEYILPDYLGDVRKVLKTSASVVPTGHFVSSDSCDAAGVVNYELIYLDSENKLSSASFTSDYEFSYPINRDKYEDSYITSSVSSYSVRLTGPRRASAKCSVVSDVTLVEGGAHEVKGDALERDDSEKISKTVFCESLSVSESCEREYAEEMMTLENTAADDIEVITSSAYVSIRESTPVDDGVNIKGVLVVTAIIRTPDMTPFAIRREIPFDETVKIGLGEGSVSSSANVFASSVSCGVTEADGAAKINANVILEMQAAAYKNESVTLIKDAYLKSRGSENVYEPFNYSEHISSLTFSPESVEKFTKSELESEGLKEVMTLSAEFKSVSCEKAASSLKIQAETQFSGIACEINESGEENLAPLKFTRNCEFNVNLNCQIDENTDIALKIMPTLCECSVDDEGMTVKYTPTISLTVSRVQSERVLAESNASGEYEYETNASRISVYYPESDETLFDIAKRFHTTAAAIASDNGISDAVSASGDGYELSSGFEKLIIR